MARRIVLLLMLALSAIAADRDQPRSEKRDHRVSVARRCAECDRDASTNRIARSAAARREFMREHACPATGKTTGACPGYVVDHVRALACGGADSPSNMQWQTVADAKEKDNGSGSAATQLQPAALWNSDRSDGAAQNCPTAVGQNKWRDSAEGRPFRERTPPQRRSKGEGYRLTASDGMWLYQATFSCWCRAIAPAIPPSSVASAPLPPVPGLSGIPRLRASLVFATPARSG
jgi:hypothetical protein